MKRLNLTNPQDYLALLVRRKWWILWPFLALSSAVILLTHILPRMYVSETLILIRPRDVPQDFVKDLIAGTTEQRLSAIEQTVLSRTNLIQILHEFEETLPEYRNFNMDQRVLRLKSQIKVVFEAERRGNVQLPVTYFRVSYQNGNPELAQKIASKLAALFIEQDNRSRETQVFGTTEFLTGELQKVADQLKDSETKLKAIRASRRYELPDQLETNLKTLDRLGLQKQANAEALDRYATIRLNLERLISETQPVIPRQTPGGTPAAGKSSLLEEYRKKKTELDDLSLKYTANHPEVEAAKLQLERLKKKIPPEDLASFEQQQSGKETEPQTPTMPNPVYQNLISQLQEVKTEFEIRERERKFVETEIEKYNQRVLNAPQSEQEIAEVLRQNTDLNKQYESLKNSLTQAKLSESLESRQKGSQFVIVDPANYPLLPTKPAKTMIAIGGMLLSLLAAVACALVADLLGQKIWTGSEVEALLGVPVLVEIPAIVSSSEVAVDRRKRFTLIASSFAVGVGYCFGLYLIYIKQGYVLLHLDSFLQRLY